MSSENSGFRGGVLGYYTEILLSF